MKLYFHLAWDGIRKNRRLYVPYLLTGVGAAALFYILLALANGPAAQMNGGDSLSLILRLGSFVLAIFSALLLFYTNSFLIRRRNREFALYNVLGMGKGNIARILVWGDAALGGHRAAGRAHPRRSAEQTRGAGAHAPDGRRDQLQLSPQRTGRAPDGAVFRRDLCSDPTREHRPHPRREPRAAAAQRAGGESPRARTGCSARRVWYCSARPTGSPSASASRSRRSCGSSSRS